MKFALPVFIFALFASCFNPGDCLISATNYMHIQFKKKSNHTLDTAISFSYHSISVSGTDSVYRIKTATAVILLPLDINSDVTTFVFHRMKAGDTTMTAVDTLKIGYIRQGKVISPDCGAFT